jgi:hypothetical protein
LAGFPGEKQGVITVPQYADTGKMAHLNANGPAGRPGTYTVEFVLAKPDARNAQKTSSASLTTFEAIHILRSQNPQ